MKDNFWGFIWQSFLEIYAVPATFLGIIISILAWIISAKTQVSLALVITMAVFTVIIIITLFHSAYKAFRKTKQLESELKESKQINQNLVNELNKLKVPRILRVQKEQSTGIITCLFDNSDLFADQVTISVFYNDEYGFEALIGIGYIKSIQNNNRIQAVIDQPVLAYQDILDRLISNDQTILERTLVRPGTPKKFNQQP